MIHVKTDVLPTSGFKIADFSKFKMAAGRHFGFWPLLGLAHTFTRGIGAHFVLNTSNSISEDILNMINNAIALPHLEHCNVKKKKCRVLYHSAFPILIKALYI